MVKGKGLERLLLNTRRSLVTAGSSLILAFGGLNIASYASQTAFLNETEHNISKHEAMKSAFKVIEEYYHPFSLIVFEYGQVLASRNYILSE